MTETETFLDEYKRLESILRETDTAESVLDYENAITESDSDTSDKLKVCRTIRIYIQHHEDGYTFLTATDAMCEFITRQADLIALKKQKVKDAAKKQKSITASTPVGAALDAASKTEGGWIVVISEQNRDPLGILTVSDLVILLGRAKDLETSILNIRGYAKTLSRDFLVAKEAEDADAYADSLRSGIRVVVTDKNRKYRGVLL